MRNAVQALVDVLPNARRLTLEGQTHEVDPTILDAGARGVPHELSRVREAR